MNSISLRAFADELSDIFGLQKESAGMMREIGTAVGNTLKGFTTPVQATKAGLRESFRMGNDLGSKVWGYGMGIGMPLWDIKSQVLPAEDPFGEGRSRFQRAAELGARTAGGFIGMATPHVGKHTFIAPAIASMAGAEIGGAGARTLFRGGKAIKRRIQKTPDAPMGTQPGELETPHVPVTGERPADIAG